MILHTLGLRVAQQRDLLAALATSTQVRVRAQAMDLEHSVVADLTGLVFDGQVNGDATAQVTRSATLTLLDPHRTLPFDSTGPSATALYQDRMVRLTWRVLVPAWNDWQSIVLFTGPVAGLRRDGDQVQLTCQGKEILAMGACWQPLTIHKGTKKTDAIRIILRERAGETRFNIPDLPARLPHTITLTTESVPWIEAQKLAASMAMQLFYDAYGTCVLRRYRSTPVFTFTGRHVVTRAVLDMGAVDANASRVIGAQPKGSKSHVQWSELAPAGNPLSPDALGRNGVRRVLLPGGRITQDSSVKTTAEAKALANRQVEDGIRQGVDLQFESLPGPGAILDPGDTCRLATSDAGVTFRLSTWSMPLTVGNNLTVGAHKRVSLLHVRRRTHAAKGHAHR